MFVITPFLHVYSLVLAFQAKNILLNNNSQILRIYCSTDPRFQTDLAIVPPNKITLYPWFWDLPSFVPPTIPEPVKTKQEAGAIGEMDNNKGEGQ